MARGNHPKRCPKCGELKAITEFYASNTKYGRQLAAYCKPCAGATCKKSRAAHLEKVLAREKMYRDRTKEKRAAQFAAWYAKNKHIKAAKDADKNLKKYGMTRVAYDALSASQSGVCAICQEPEKSYSLKLGRIIRLAVDHDHETGAVRGLLCANCNRAVGLLKNSPARAMSLADYLRRHGLHAVKEVR